MCAPFHIEMPIHCLDGTTRRVIVSGLPDGQQKAARQPYSGIILDVTGQRKALEDALRTAAEYRLLIENSTDRLPTATQTAGTFQSLLLTVK